MFAYVCSRGIFKQGDSWTAVAVVVVVVFVVIVVVVDRMCVCISSFWITSFYVHQTDAMHIHFPICKFSTHTQLTSFSKLYIIWWNFLLYVYVYINEIRYVN